uniref:Uncharacterized protein n=1 Tax=Onchocerca volvulus TaxID=6282 RepID=A0A8R1Y523_ONCVO
MHYITRNAIECTITSTTVFVGINIHFIQKGFCFRMKLILLRKCFEHSSDPSKIKIVSQSNVEILAE